MRPRRASRKTLLILITQKQPTGTKDFGCLFSGAVLRYCARRDQISCLIITIIIRPKCCSGPRAFFKAITSPLPPPRPSSAGLSNKEQLHAVDINSIKSRLFIGYYEKGFSGLIEMGHDCGVRGSGAASKIWAPARKSCLQQEGVRAT